MDGAINRDDDNDAMRARKRSLVCGDSGGRSLADDHVGCDITTCFRVWTPIASETFGKFAITLTQLKGAKRGRGGGHVT